MIVTITKQLMHVWKWLETIFNCICWFGWNNSPHKEPVMQKAFPRNSSCSSDSFCVVDMPQQRGKICWTATRINSYKPRLSDFAAKLDLINQQLTGYCNASRLSLLSNQYQLYWTDDDHTDSYYAAWDVITRRQIAITTSLTGQFTSDLPLP